MFISRETLLAQPFSEAQEYLAQPSIKNIAYFMAEELIDQLRAEKPDVADDLHRLADQLFKEGKQDPKLYQELINKYRDDMASHMLLVSNYVLIGHFLGLSVLERENLFDIYRKKRDDQLKDFDPQRDSVPTLNEDDMIPGGIERVLFPISFPESPDPYLGQRAHQFKSAQEAVKYFSIPVFIPILTTHPTFVDTLETQQIIRELHDAWREIMLRPKDFSGYAFSRLQQIIRDFRHTELTPVAVDVAGHKKIAHFTPFQETSFELDALRHIFKYHDEAYQTVDNAFARRYGADYTDELREELNLHIIPTSWIISDKDGNKNLRSEHVLQSIVRRRLLALELVRAEISDLENMGLKPGSDINWPKVLTTAQRNLQSIEDRLEEVRAGGIDISLNQSEFDDLIRGAQYPFGHVHTFAEMESRLKHDVDGLKQTIDSNDPEAKRKKQKLLTFTRKLKSFGLKLALSEYRETSVEYTQVIATLLTRDPFTGETLDYNPDIKDKNELAKLRIEQAKLLDRIIREKPDYLKILAENFLRDIESTKDLRSFSKNDPGAMVYHTLKRAKIAAANPDLFQDTVVAECQGPSNVMEVMALLHMFRPGDSKQPINMHITMLLEDLDKLEAAPDMVMELLRHRAYRDHLMQLAGGDIAKLLIKIQVAHSDNTRRGGTAAARAAIYDVHFAIRAALQSNHEEIKELLRADGHDVANFAIEAEFSEGGSNSDALRNGKRAMTATINAYELFKTFKTTFQGQSDLLGCLGLSTSYKRIMARFFTHCAKEVAYRETNEVAKPAASALHQLVSQVLKKGTLEDYENQHFNELSNQIGHLFAHALVNYLLYGVVYNRGSRAAQRGEETTSLSNDNEPIDTANIRTIGFSNVFMDANILPSWLGIRLFTRRFSAALKESEGAAALKELSSRMSTPVFNANGQISNAALQMLYREQPMFRDVIDKVAYGLVESDIGKLQSRLKMAKAYGIDITPEIEGYVANLRLEYEKAALLVLGTFGVDTATISHDANRLVDYDAYLEHVRQMVLDTGLKHLKEDVVSKQTFSAFLEAVRDDTLVTVYGRSSPGDVVNFSDAQLLLLSNTASGVLAARHGRVLAADDPSYAKALRHYRQSMKLAA